MSATQFHFFPCFSNLVDRTLVDEEGLMYDYDRVFSVLSKKYPNVFSPEIFTFQEWLWSWSLIWSRGFYTKLKKSGPELLVLVPFGDVMNRINEDQVECTK